MFLGWRTVWRPLLVVALGFVVWFTRWQVSSGPLCNLFCAELLVEGTVSDERRRSRSHFHHMPRLTVHDRSKLSVTLLNLSYDGITFLWNMRHLFKWFHFWATSSPSSQLMFLAVLVVMSVLSLGRSLMVLLSLEPCGPHRWNSSIYCVTVKHQQHGPLVRNGYGMKVTQENISRCKSVHWQMETWENFMHFFLRIM